MPTANGFIKSTSSGTKFTASFVINNLQYSYAGSLSPSLQPFACQTAVLTYTTIGELTTTRSYEGIVGTKKVKIEIANGPTIEGTLDDEIDPSSTIGGNAVWTVS